MTIVVRVTPPADVRAVLDDPHFAVPEAPDEGAEVGTVAWLRREVARFATGDRHRHRRGLAVAGLAELDPALLRATARRWTARGLIPRTVPVAALGTALGVPDAAIATLVPAVTAVAAAYQPGADPGALAAADQAVRALTDLLAPAGPDPVDPAALANRIGLLVQTCAATGALVETALRHAARPDRPAGIDDLLGRALAAEPPAPATTRIATDGARLGDRPVPAGTVLRVELAGLPFGAGPHACPGSTHALALAAGVLDALLEDDSR